MVWNARVNQVSCRVRGRLPQIPLFPDELYCKFLDCIRASDHREAEPYQGLASGDRRYVAQRTLPVPVFEFRRATRRWWTPHSGCSPPGVASIRAAFVPVILDLDAETTAVQMVPREH